MPLSAGLLLTGFLLLAPGVAGAAPPALSHAAWDALLKKHVDGRGLVNYRAFRADSLALNAYLKTLADHPPAQSWPQPEQLAYWLNAYNAFTVQRVLRGYPVRSIRELGGPVNGVNTVWDQRFIRLGGQRYSLNDIEQRIIRRQFQEPRVHFALVCAAVSCPRLRREAYTGARLDAQLQAQGVDFVNDPAKNQLTPARARLSGLFEFYPEDFRQGGHTLPQTVNRFARRKLNPDAQISYLPYNWALNEQP